MDERLEVIVIPVSDVDRAKEFYGNLGWRLDADRAAGDNFRIVQLTPPGSNRCWRPSRHALDIQVVIDVDVVGGAVAAAGAAAERKGGHQVVIDAAERANRSGRVHDDSAGINDLAELTDDFVVFGENDCGMSEPSQAVHLHTNLQRFFGGLGAIDRQHREQLLDG